MRRHHRYPSELDDEKPLRSRDEAEVSLEPNMLEPQRTRIERLEIAESLHRSTSIPKMTSESRSALQSLESVSSHGTKDRYRAPEETRRRRRRRPTARDTKGLQSPRDGISQRRRADRDEESSESGEDAATQSGSVEATPARRKTRVIYVAEGNTRSSTLKESRRIETRRLPDDTKRNEESVRRSRAHRPRRASVGEVATASPPKRSNSTRVMPAAARPSLKRSSTTTAGFKSHHTPTLASTVANHKRSSFLGSFFGPLPQPHREPEKLVECLTCLSDDVPRSKSAKLKCGHRMCHSCLRRIFKLSITDPQHMPPKCCTADHIPLKHVDRLFDNNFKKTWNLKFQEYSTKNRIYCPARRCGEWIKPGDIHKEDGRKYGKCSRCKTKVCCLCSGKWHGKKDCPKDEETNQLLEAAKQAGWQRCHSCRVMVELKEGCNHMTCRCGAEFCMVCGIKWKSCNCPWFNYETVEQDRLDHMRVPGEIQEEEELAPRRPAHWMPWFIAPDNEAVAQDRLNHIQVPRDIQEPRPRLVRPRHPVEMHGPRRQQRAEEDVLRRLERATLEEAADNDYQGGIGDVHGIGNGAGHFMNENYVRATDNNLAGNVHHATAAANYVMGVARARNPPISAGSQRRKAHRPVPLRRHTMREHAYNTAPSTRPSERVVPRRTRTDYESEAAVHAPAERAPQRSASMVQRNGPSRSVLAGLGGAGRGSHRVSAWRRHVEPGIEPGIEPAQSTLST